MYFRGSCYQIYTVPKNHDEAEAVCQQNGWHLATINNIEEQHFIIGQTQRLDREKCSTLFFLLAIFYFFLKVNGSDTKATILVSTTTVVRHRGLGETVRNWAWFLGKVAIQTQVPVVIVVS